MYLVFLAPALLLVLWAQAKVTGTYRRMSQIRARSGFTGAQAATRILAERGIRVGWEGGSSGALSHGGTFNVTVGMSPGGPLSDHYNPASHTLRLSPGVYDGDSLAAIGIAAHEAGHAVQHAEGYVWLGLRTAVVPATAVARFAPLLFIAGLLFQLPVLVNVAVWLYGAIVLFTLITLPVEWNASQRATQMLTQSGVLAYDEEPKVKAVLRAAAMTYVAAAATALLTFLYFLFRRR
jgi:hypothetical protein